MEDAKKTIMDYKEKLEEKMSLLLKESNELRVLFDQMVSDFNLTYYEIADKDIDELLWDLDNSRIDQTYFDNITAMKVLSDTIVDMMGTAQWFNEKLLE